MGIKENNLAIIEDGEWEYFRIEHGETGEYRVSVYPENAPEQIELDLSISLENNS